MKNKEKRCYGAGQGCQFEEAEAVANTRMHTHLHIVVKYSSGRINQVMRLNLNQEIVTDRRGSFRPMCKKKLWVKIHYNAFKNVV